MNPEELAKIKARAKAATSGPWIDQITDDGYLRVTADESAVNGICGFGDMEETDGQDHYNATFIAYARADIPALLTEVERLQNALNEVMEFNPLRNDRDAYLLAICEWGLKGKWGVNEEFTERPQMGIFGLE